jgi:hypothetical protein
MGELSHLAGGEMPVFGANADLGFCLSIFSILENF